MPYDVILIFAICDLIGYLIQPVVQMIKGILIINNHGKPRLVKFYQSVVRSGKDDTRLICTVMFVYYG